MRYSFETDRTDRSSKHCHWSEDTIDSEADKVNLERFQRSDRRRSLERQTGFDESVHDFIEHHNQSNQSSYDYHDSTEYPQSSFDSYQSYNRDDSVSTDWEKGSRYTPTQSYVEQDSYYNEWAENEAPLHKPSSNKYVHDERTDWSKVNGSVGGRNARPKPAADEWRNDSTGSEWKRSVDSDWSRDSTKNEWNQDVPVVKEPSHHGRNTWNDDSTSKKERTPVVEPAQKDGRWTNHAPEHPKDVDRRNSKPSVAEPVRAVDHWNNQRVEPPVVKNSDKRNSSTKNRDQWNNHVPEIPKVSEPWNDHPKETIKSEDRWNDHPPETVKNGERWNDHPKEAVKSVDLWNDHRKDSVKSVDRWNDQPKESVKTTDQWNDHSKEITKNGEQWNDHPKETTKANDRWNGHSNDTTKGIDRWNGHSSDATITSHTWNGPNETVQEDDDWMMNTSSVDTVKNAETWKNREPMNSGWSEETIVQDWEDDRMAENQIDNIINDWQEENEQNEWLPEDERFEEDITKPEFPDQFDNEPVINERKQSSELKPQIRNSIDYSGNLTVNGKDADIISDRRPSVLSMKGVVPPVEPSGLLNDLLFPASDVPTLTIDDDPNMSRAKRRWINAFNKIVAQLNEVRFTVIYISSNHGFFIVHRFLSFCQVISFIPFHYQQ